MNLLQHLQGLFRDALRGLTDDPVPYAAMVKAAQDARFGDYQANCAMSLAKQLNQKPRDVAERIVKNLNLGDLLEKPEVAGPGFINLRLRSDWLAAQLQHMAADDHLGVAPAVRSRTFVIDYSSPNVAKPMHVGHLRSTIIGDALARLLRLLGHRVISDNHLGDWGTQFGMLLYGYKHHRDAAALAADPVQEMVRLYKLVRSLIKPAEPEDEDDGEEPKKRTTEEEKTEARKVLEAVRQETARLHAGDEENVGLWKRFMPWCHEEIERVYRRLDVKFDHTLGESFYNPALAGVVDELLQKGIAQESRGAVVIPQGPDQPPAMIRKTDGAFTYTTSDLATIRYRMEQWAPDALLYVVDFRQGLHFRQLFEAARRWGHDRAELEHISFGSVLDPRTRKPMKTRAGDNTGLMELLDEAARHAAQVYQQNREERQQRGEEVPELAAEELALVCEAVGVGAVKYADLCQNRTSDYVFDWNKMLATDGNTATYMQYAYTRNRGIFRKGEEDDRPFRTQPPLPTMEAPEERALAVQLLRFSESLESAAAEYKPNTITDYLWNLSKAYSSFFVKCKVLKAPTPELRRSRLLLCDLTARVIQRGLDLLGIRTVERM